MVATDVGGNGTERSSPLVQAAHRLAARIETLVEEVARLREDNATLRSEVREAVDLLEGAGSGVAPGRSSRRGTVVAARTAAVNLRRRRRGRATKGRATPTDVTSDVVRAVLVKLGEATAAEIAAEITRARAEAGVTGSTPVGGRAVRFLAERAGATTRVSEDGQRRYRLG